MKINKLTLTYDNQVLQDGSGAQIQRILGIAGIAKFLRLGYFHSGISGLHITWSDPFQTPQEVDSYLNELNADFNIPSDANSNFDLELRINYLTPKYLAKYYLIGLFTRKRILLKVFSPYYFTDKSPNLYNFAVSELFKQTELNSNKIKIVVHVRFANLISKKFHPDYTKGRILDENFYISILDEILDEISNSANDTQNTEINLHVDSPPEVFRYLPKTEQIQVWRDFGYEMEGNYLLIESFKIEQTAFHKYRNCKVLYGLSPMEAWKDMQNADYLIISNSSFSYVGALLNKYGKVFCSMTHQHKPKKNWILK